MSISEILSSFGWRTNFVRIGFLLASTGLATGCGGNIVTAINAVPPVTPGATSATGNWQLHAQTTSGTTPFTDLSGSIVQEAPQPSGYVTIASILQASKPGACYTGLTTIPMLGFRSADTLFSTSLSIVGQYLSLAGTLTSTSDTMSGTFSIAGGCADGVKGTINGIRISPFTGTYTGPWNTGAMPATITLSVVQNSSSDGLGYFHLTGSARIAGISCFTSGTIQDAASTITGQQVKLTLLTNEMTASTVLMMGTLNQAADTATFSTIQIASGSCVGTGGTGILSR